MRKYILVLFAFFLNVITHAQSLNFEWAKQMGGIELDRGKSVAVDASGNVYTTGCFSGTGDFDPGTVVYNLSAAAAVSPCRTAFISKLDSSGNFIWAKQIGGTISGNYVNAELITVDALGNSYITGNFDGTIDFNPGTGTFNLTGSNDMFVLKLNASGNFMWADVIKGGATIQPNDITLSANGFIVYITGHFNGTVDFDPGLDTLNLSSTISTYYDAFVLVVYLDGSFAWANAIGGSKSDYGQSIAVDGSNNVYVTGSFTEMANFGKWPNTYYLTSNGYSDVFVLKLDAVGGFVWAKKIGGTSADEGSYIAISSSGNVYVTGSFMDLVDFDPGTGINILSAVGDRDAFIVKFSNSGAYDWAAQMGDIAEDVGRSTAMDAAGNIYTMGTFHGTIDCDPGAGTSYLTSTSSGSPFIIKLDPSDNFVWAHSLGGSDTYIDAIGNIYATGAFGNTFDFDPGTGIFDLTPVGDWDIYVTKMGQSSVTMVEDHLPAKFQLFPNPSSGKINIVFDNQLNNATMSVMDLTGRTIMQKNNFNGNNFKLDISEQANSIYFIEVNQSGSSVRLKMIKN